MEEKELTRRTHSRLGRVHFEYENRGEKVGGGKWMDGLVAAASSGPEAAALPAAELAELRHGQGGHTLKSKGGLYSE